LIAMLADPTGVAPTSKVVASFIPIVCTLSYDKKRL
jgi:hypothetical protein